MINIRAGFGTSRTRTRRFPGVKKEENSSRTLLKVLELHEAFAGQVLANLKALDSEKFCQEKLGLKEKVPKS